MDIVFYIVPVVAIINLFLELKRDLMMLQQNSYRNERYMRWLRSSGDTTSASRLIAIVILFLSLTSFCPNYLGAYLYVNAFHIHANSLII